MNGSRSAVRCREHLAGGGAHEGDLHLVVVDGKGVVVVLDNTWHVVELRVHELRDLGPEAVIRALSCSAR
jgi:hypothetical protein